MKYLRDILDDTPLLDSEKRKIIEEINDNYILLFSDVSLLQKAYVFLLASRFVGRTSTEGQQLLSALRDSIAFINGVSIQYTQDSHEEMAMDLKEKYKTNED